MGDQMGTPGAAGIGSDIHVAQRNRVESGPLHWQKRGVRKLQEMKLEYRPTPYTCLGLAKSECH